MPHAGAAALMLVLAVLGTSAASDAAGSRSASRATARAVLKPIAGTPFRVRGSRFQPNERVRVTVTPTGRTGIVRRVRASRRGTFVLAFRGLEACQGVHGTARGSRGSRAAFQFSSVRC